MVVGMKVDQKRGKGQPVTKSYLPLECMKIILRCDGMTREWSSIESTACYACCYCCTLISSQDALVPLLLLRQVVLQQKW